MHRTKRQARNLAWQDKNNPFARRWAFRTPSDELSALENGQLANSNGAPLARLNTDDPSDYRGQTLTEETRDWGNGSSSKHAATSPTAISRKRNDEPGDHVGEMQYTASPPASFKDAIPEESAYNEKGAPMVNGNTRSHSEKSPEPDQTKKRHGLKDLLHGSTTDKKEEAEDDNGKTKKKKKHFTFMSQIKATLFNSWINILLIASPIGIALNYTGVTPVAIFVVNFIAIIPLAGMLSYATEEIALRTGEVIGGLLNATFGNAVELIVSIIALLDDQILIVQTSLIGSMLSNLLLVMGMCFFAGGVNRVEQAFNITVAQTAASLLFLAVSSLLIPTVFQLFANTSTEANRSTLSDREAELSRGTAVLLLFVYGCYLFFQLKSHTKMYTAASEKNQKRDFTKHKNRVKNLVPQKIRRRSLEAHSDEDESNDDEAEEPQLSLWVAIFTLAASTALVAVNAEYLVDSIDAITEHSSVSKTFVGLILLPIVGNAAEHATAVTVAIKDKMDLAIGVAVGSSIQIALLVLPLIVILGWIIGKHDMTLYFDGFQIAVLFTAVLLVNYLIQDGKSHWLEGVLLMTMYTTIAVAAWFTVT